MAIYTKNPELKKKIFKLIRRYENLAIRSYEKGNIKLGKKYEKESDNLYRKNYKKIFTTQKKKR